MDPWKTKLVRTEKIIEHLEQKDKNQQWFNNLNSRGHRLLPKKSVTPRLEPQRTKKGIVKVKPRGRIVWYPEEILGYLDRIIFMQDDQHMSLNEIERDPEVQKELCKLNLLVETELAVDSRARGSGPLENFEAAKANLAKVMRWGQGSDLLKFLDEISRNYQRYWKDYFAVNATMREQALSRNKIDDDLRFRKMLLGHSLDNQFLIMHKVTEIGVKLLKENKITLGDWFAATRVVKR